MIFCDSELQTTISLTLYIENHFIIPFSVEAAQGML
jgi:hypothetical protein